ncbi:Tyrosyl-DNA phosphodiesterase 1 [Madurella mycetomatis]|uniref:Tyrosyl-DNA phosphodiesterase 1 n=1 Tax=Madurella mycetomatis TaxID=100816 RepID=A0A175W768_9PEZI|nr:Tyrosyl-DNA phosphodiesterase 1 [Madurella mycetomatis]
MADKWAAAINGDEDEDEALRIAIARSLDQAPTKRPKKQALLKDDGDAGRLERVMDSGHTGQQVPSEIENAPSPLSSFSALGLDRKKMEEERLARLNKRKASGPADVSTSRPAQRPKIATAPSSVLSDSVHGKERALEKSEPAVSAKETRDSSLSFPRGAVKKTWAFGQPRHGDDIRIEEVLQKHQLELAVLSSHQWDEEWLLSKIDLARTKLILIAFATDKAQREEMQSNVPRERIRFCFPPMQAMGSMHSKLQLLKYGKYMRIVVPTGNLMPYDWGETGTMENMVFIIDLPKFQSAEEQNAQKLTPFGEELSYFLLAQGLDEKLVGSLRNYDFSETSRYGFVHTIAGSHTADDAWRRTGYCGLGRMVRSLGIDSSGAIELDYVCSSLGAVNDGLLRALYYACQGDSGLKEYDTRKAGRNTKNASSTKLDAIRDHLRVYFPSRGTVIRSKGGKDGAGTICFQAKWWQAESFPHSVLRDCKSVRDGLVMHSKIIYVRFETRGGFVYVGSANLSESAWKGNKIDDRKWDTKVIVPT